MDKITTVGLDLAKQVMAVHGVDAAGPLVARKVLRRDQVLSWAAALPPCVMAMEACGGAHHQARRRLPAHAADSGRQERVASSLAQATGATAPLATMDRCRAGAHRLSQDHGGDRQQACAHHLGAVGEGRMR